MLGLICWSGFFMILVDPSDHWEKTTNRRVSERFRKFAAAQSKFRENQPIFSEMRIVRAFLDW
jgi:hypothetical protein